MSNLQLRWLVTTMMTHCVVFQSLLVQMFLESRVILGSFEVFVHYSREFTYILIVNSHTFEQDTGENMVEVLSAC